MLAILLGLSQEELVKKMGSLRTYFGNKVGKERYSKTSGSGRKEVYTPKWPFFKSLQFLKDNIHQERQSPTYNSSSLKQMNKVISAYTMTWISTGNQNTPPVVDNCGFKLNNPPPPPTPKKKKKK